MQDRFHQVETLKQLTKRGWLAPLLNLNRAGTVFLRTSYIGICMHTGLFDALKQRPMRADELAGPLGIDPQMADQLVEWLSAGVQLGVLGERNGRYRIRSREVRRLLRPGLAPIAAFYEELVYVELPVLLDTPRSLRSGKLFEVADADPAVVARASRLSEPFISSALLSVVEPTGPCRVLEIGCGTGGNILAAAALNPDLTVVGIDLDADVANLAKANIAEAGLASRVEIEVGDALERPAQADFDLVTLHQNIYYFAEDARVDVLGKLARHLKPGGQLLVTTMVRESGPLSGALNLWGAMTKGASRLPLPDELAADLKVAGYRDVRVIALDGFGQFYAFVGRQGD